MSKAVLSMDDNVLNLEDYFGQISKNLRIIYSENNNPFTDQDGNRS